MDVCAFHKYLDSKSQLRWWKQSRRNRFTVNGVGYFGTGITSATSPQKDVWKYNKSKDTWSSIANLPSAACSGAIGFGIGLKGYLGTGYDVKNFLKDIYEYDPKANTWKKTDSIPTSLSVRGFSVSFVISGSAYFGAGYGTAVSNSLNDFWSLTPKIKCVAYFTTDPFNQSVNMYDTAKFSALSNDTSASYKWQMNAGTGFTDISDGGQYLGVNNDTLNIKNLTQANDNQKFRCILTLGGCLDTSETASLLVSCKPLIQNHPINRTAYISGNTFLHVTSADPKATFKWQTDLGLGSQNISNAGQYKGVTNDTLSINNLTVTNDNQAFRCLLSNGSCFDTSATANLTVRSVGIKESINKNGVTIFPNPSHDFVTITIASILLNNSYKIIDQQGRIVGSDRLTETSTKINIEHLATGVYILQTEPVISQTMILKD